MMLGTRPFCSAPLCSIGSGLFLAVSDTITISETVLRIFELSVIDNLVITESTSPVDMTHNISVSDTISLVEQIDRPGIFNLSVTDTLTLTETMRRIFEISLTDNININEAIGLVLNLHQYVTDSISINEGIHVLNALQRIRDTIN